MLPGTLLLAAVTFIPAVLAGGYLRGLLQALDEGCLDQLANVTASLNSTPTGQVVLAQLSQGNNTLFAPTDEALSVLDPAIFNNATVLADLIAYHIVKGNSINQTNQTQTYPNVTIGRTLLNDSALVTLEGNQSQVLLWSKADNGSLFVINQGSNVSVVNTTTYDNTSILTIDSVLTIPPNISAVLNNPSYNLTDAAAFLNSTSPNNGFSLVDALSSAHGITLFVPDNAGVQAAQSSLAGIAKNTTALLSLLSNHVISGASVYSTEVSPGTNLTSAGGQSYAFFTNSTGTYVSVGGSNQVKIVGSDLLTSNGVIHVVNGVMLDTNSNPAAVSSALGSATSVAASVTQSASTTSPPSSSPSPSTTESGSTSSPSPSPPPSGGGMVKGDNNWKLGVLAAVVVGFGQLV